MKKEEIIITENTILLGVFGTPVYEWFSKNTIIKGWAVFNQQVNGYNVIDIVEKAAINSEKIVFLLDKVEFPINIKHSITCQELQLICNNEELFNKTVFVKGDNVINFDKNIL